VPRFEIWIDALLDGLGQDDPADAYVNLGQDCVMMPARNPPHSNAWRNGVDEWGRVWQDGMFVDGVVDTAADLEQYSPPLSYVEQLYDGERIRQVRESYPHHCLIFGAHIGPFTAGYMAMGFERFFVRLVEDPAFVGRLLEARTEWCMAMYQKAVSLGAEVLVLGDDAGHGGGPMISPRMWRELVLPCHRRIVDALDVPMIWHSDGNVASLLPTAIEAGFVGFHGSDPLAGMDLARIKREFGRDLVLIGNVDVRTLCSADLAAVRREVDRCIAQGAPGGGYMIASCNSIFDGMNPLAVAEMFRYEEEVGYY
jgi:uroporphyrinogen decarboxylase